MKPKEQKNVFKEEEENSEEDTFKNSEEDYDPKYE